MDMEDFEPSEVARNRERVIIMNRRNRIPGRRLIGSPTRLGTYTPQPTIQAEFTPVCAGEISNGFPLPDEWLNRARLKWVGL
jgi:hypothetical protein